MVNMKCSESVCSDFRMVHAIRRNSGKLPVFNFFINSKAFIRITAKSFMNSPERSFRNFQSYTKPSILTASDPKCMRNYTFMLTTILCRLATAEQQFCTTCMVLIAICSDYFCDRMFYWLWSFWLNFGR